MAAKTLEEYNGFRFIKALNLCGRRVLYKTFCWGTPDKLPNTKLDEYLKNLNHKSTANYLKLPSKERRFNKTQKKLINASPDGTGFDVPLLCLSIKLACENVASFSDEKWITQSTELEYYITAIKDMRNDALHGLLVIPDEVYYEYIRKLRELLTGCLKTSGKRYGQNEVVVDCIIKEMHEDLDNIMNEILGVEDILKYCSDELKYVIINNSCDQLKEIFQKRIFINPLSFITKDFQLEVGKIFVDVEIMQGKRRGQGEHIDYRDLLKLVQTTSVSSSVSSATQQQCFSSRPQMLLLEGIAGSGKTTLVMLVIKEWTQGCQGQIIGLDNYELLLWVQCRDPTMNSYQDLLDRLMKNVSEKFRNVLQRILKLFKILIIIDSLDELNDNSSALVKSLLHEFQNSLYTTFICTSRPEKVELFRLRLPEEYEVTNVELRGITEKHMPEFVRLTHQEIIKHTKSNRNTEELVNKVKVSEGLHEHLRLPMNLTFFVYLWDQTGDELNMMTTQTELYHEIHQLCQRKLLERLKHCSLTKTMNETVLKQRVQEILLIIYMMSLKSLSHNQLTFEEEEVKQMISACNKRDIPYDEILSAFLCLKPTWTWLGIEEKYCAPHKGIHDFFGAMHIVLTFKYQLHSSPLPVLCTQHAKPSLSSQSPTTTLSPSHTQLSPTLASPLPTSPNLAAPKPSPTSVVPSSASPSCISPTSAQLNAASVTPQFSSSIREVLEQSVGGAIVDMTKYYNVLFHMAGLLHLLLDQVPEATVSDTVHLLHESGMKDHDQWLDLLENTKCNDNVAREIAPLSTTKTLRKLIFKPVRIVRIVQENIENIVVNDHRIESYKALLPHLRPVKVHINMKSEPNDMPGLRDLLDVLICHQHQCTDLELYHHYDHDDTTTTSDDVLQRLQPKSDLKVFRGLLTGDGVSLLPRSLKHLHLAVVSDDHARCLLPKLHAVVNSSLPQLFYLHVRVPVGVSPAALMPLPSTRILMVELELNDVNDAGVSEACHVVRKLHPKGRFWMIRCTNSTVTEVGIQHMIRGLARRRVKVNWLEIVTSVTITPEQQQPLITMAKTTLKSRFTIHKCKTETSDHVTR